jgi:hypothetical protein
VRNSASKIGVVDFTTSNRHMTAFQAGEVVVAGKGAIEKLVSARTASSK